MGGGLGHYGTEDGNERDPNPSGRVLTNYLSMTDTEDPDTHRLVHKPSQAVQQGQLLTRPTPARQDAPFHRQGRSKRRGEVDPLRYVEPLNATKTPLADLLLTTGYFPESLVDASWHNGRPGLFLRGFVYDPPTSHIT